MDNLNGFLNFWMILLIFGGVVLVGFVIGKMFGDCCCGVKIIFKFVINDFKKEGFLVGFWIDY